MVDVLTPAQRRFNMSRIRSRDTKPEIVVRSIVHRMGYRFRLHDKNLPGKPDIVLPRHRKIIDVRGCFFHMHSCRYGRVKPATNDEFWLAKRQSNRLRDKRNARLLRDAGWDVLVIWECETKALDRLERMLGRFLSKQIASKG
ncbi:MAG: DNA mismatch endonuclease Vsr [Acidobacteria bacterium ACB1]|nr:Very short patch repair protein [Pyrinomonadaceae bacterium]MCE7961629.1 DNA mismatch endonuclease Vsr [Acidobacteria bacterium ACB1]RIJ96755.1 MAG: very short patch repair endonuclease [Acidobacteriota bacterium]